MNKIKELEKILKNAEVVDEDEVDIEKISIGCVVELHDCEYDEDVEYSIVGSTEANSLKNKISNESPLGSELLGKKTGDSVKVDTLDGVVEYKVLSIKKSN
mgnify:FL=1